MTDYGSIGTAIAMVIIATMNAYNLARSSKRDNAMKNLQASSDKNTANMEHAVTQVKENSAKLDEVIKIKNGDNV